MSLPNWVRTADRGNKEKITKLAIKDLAERVGEEVSDANITVKEIVPVTWEDMSLGYTQPGRKPAPGVIPGYQITLLHNGREYDYHTGFGRVVFVPAGKGRPPLPADAV